MQDIISCYKNSGGNPSDLPKVPVSVGGNNHFLDRDQIFTSLP